MNELRINYEQMFNELQRAEDAKTTYYPKVGSAFLDHILPILSSVILERRAGLISMKDTFSSVKDLGSASLNLDTPNGPILYRQVYFLIALLYQVKRSSFITGTMIKNTRFCTMVPLIMYAHKLYNDVNYSEWDKEDIDIKYALGKYFEDILTVKELPTFDIIEARKEALTFKTGTKAGVMDKLTSYKCNITHLGGVELPKNVIRMLLQLWVANASIRNIDSMILHPLDWDFIPDPIDETLTW